MQETQVNKMWLLIGNLRPQPLLFISCQTEVAEMITKTTAEDGGGGLLSEILFAELTYIGGVGPSSLCVKFVSDVATASAAVFTCETGVGQGGGW
jgi:hypothetical protein